MVRPAVGLAKSDDETRKQSKPSQRTNLSFGVFYAEGMHGRKKPVPDPKSIYQGRDNRWPKTAVPSRENDRSPDSKVRAVRPKQRRKRLSEQQCENRSEHRDSVPSGS